MDQSIDELLLSYVNRFSDYGSYHYNKDVNNYHDICFSTADVLTSLLSESTIFDYNDDSNNSNYNLILINKIIDHLLTERNVIYLEYLKKTESHGICLMSFH